MVKETLRPEGQDDVEIAQQHHTGPFASDCSREVASGFIYCVSTTGVTGARASLHADLSGFIARLRAYTGLPLAVGFGVSTPEQADEVAGYADGVIIGSALVDIVARNERLEDALAEIAGTLYRVRRMPSLSR